MRQPQISNYAALGYEHDFYDQSHFVREFKEFTGVVPSKFVKISLPINQHFIASD
jgi:AraC-like DNA-binding protein